METIIQEFENNPFGIENNNAIVYTAVRQDKMKLPRIRCYCYICDNGETSKKIYYPQKIKSRNSKWLKVTDENLLEEWNNIKAQKNIKVNACRRFLIYLNRTSYEKIVRLLKNTPKLDDFETEQWKKFKAKSESAIQPIVLQNPQEYPFFKRLCTIRSLEKAASEIDYWFYYQGIPLLADKRPEWTKNKTEFAEMVAEEYRKHPSLYASLPKCVDIIFNKYKFTFKWDRQKCYYLVKKS